MILWYWWEIYRPRYWPEADDGDSWLLMTLICWSMLLSRYSTLLLFCWSILFVDWLRYCPGIQRVIVIVDDIVDGIGNWPGDYCCYCYSVSVTVLTIEANSLMLLLMTSIVLICYRYWYCHWYCVIVGIWWPLMMLLLCQASSIVNEISDIGNCWYCWYWLVLLNVIPVIQF